LNGLTPLLATPADIAGTVMDHLGLEWTWGDGGAGLKHHSYGGNDQARIGCAMSHYALWKFCAALGEPIMILEHDTVFLRPFVEFDFKSACMINDPAGATPRGDWWHEQMVKRGPGVFPKMWIFETNRPDGLAGNSAGRTTRRCAGNWCRTSNSVTHSSRGLSLRCQPSHEDSKAWRCVQVAHRQ